MEKQLDEKLQIGLIFVPWNYKQLQQYPQSMDDTASKQNRYRVIFQNLD